MSDTYYSDDPPPEEFGQHAVDSDVRFFDCILTADEELRAYALQTITQNLENSLVSDPDHELIKVHLATLVRLATACPFPDIRRACAQLVDAARAVLSEADLACTRTQPVMCLYLPPQSIPTVSWDATADASTSASSDTISSSKQSSSNSSYSSTPLSSTTTSASNASSSSPRAVYPVCPHCGVRHSPDDGNGSGGVAMVAPVDVMAVVARDPIRSGSVDAFDPTSPLVDPSGDILSRPSSVVIFAASSSSSSDAANTSVPSSSSSSSSSAPSSSPLPPSVPLYRRPSAPVSVRPLFEDLFLACGRVSHFDQVLSLLPDFFTPAANTYHFVMRENGPLPLPWRNYLALLAASRFRCDSLMALQRQEFLLNNGDPAWLEGVSHAPTKIQNLLELNALLAHQPWTISTEHIQRLLRGSDAWSVAELVHAIVLLSTFHCLACVCHGIGVTTDDDLVFTPAASAFSGSGLGFATPATSTSSAPSVPSSATATATSSTGSVTPRTPRTPRTPSVPSASSSAAAAAAGGAPSSSSSDSGDPTHMLAKLLSANLESLVADVTEQQVDSEVDPASIPIRIAPAGAAGATTTNASSTANNTPSSIAIPPVSVPSSVPVSDSESGLPFSSTPTSSSSGSNPLPLSSGASSPPTPVILCPTAAPVGAVLPLLGPAGSLSARMTYEDFDLKRFTPFREQDYSWKEHGYALVNRFYQGVGPLLDAELDLIYAFTENNLGSGPEQLEHVDTGPFRRAIWYYAHRMYGMVAADFDYRQVNVFLSRPLKAFLKRVVCFPDTITRADFSDALGTYAFRPVEKLHIVLLAAEGRRQACLLYGLHAVMTHMIS